MSAPIVVRSREDMQAFGTELAAVLRAGDLVVLAGPLGAGKTTLTQGIGRGLAVAGEITSPTFVIARVHRPLDPAAGRPALVHADAYRLGSALELDDLDLDASVDTSVTVVEWGEGLVEALAEDRLVVRIDRPDVDDDADEHRVVVLEAVGPRWAGVSLPRAG
jgi:tRNA threonylcarbamoyladenosine biosynthesis protein TsaE